MKTNGKRILAIILLLILLTPFIYTVIEMNHNCIDDDCLICESIFECETLIRHISDNLLYYGITILLIGISLISYHIIYTYITISDTPILRKVRMND